MATLNDRRFAVVTGGSSGIGLELAKQFLAHDFDVMIVADGPDIVDVASGLISGGGVVFPQRIDLASSEGVAELCRELDGMHRPVDALAINAGVGVGGRFIETDCAAEVRMIRLDCESVVTLAKYVIPRMVQRGEGRVLITSSIAGTTPAPYEAVYGATRAFALSFAEALHGELEGTGVTVTAMQPGPTDTRFFERTGLEDTKVGVGPKDDPAEVARQGFEAMMNGVARLVVGSMKTVLVSLANEVLPEATKAKLHARMADPGSGRKQ